MNKKNLALSCAALLLFFQNTNAQSFTPDVISTAGTFATSPSGSMSWTIGEVMTETYSSANNFFTQGFHQPDTSFVISVSNQSSQNVSIYPNPVITNLIIDFSGTSNDHSIYIYDMLGNVLRKEFISENQKQVNISFREFANGVYLLNILNTGTNYKVSYKINKAE